MPSRKSAADRRDGPSPAVLPEGGPAPFKRWLLSLFVVAHFAIVCAAPLAVHVQGFGPRLSPPRQGPPPPPNERITMPAVFRFAEFIQPYLDGLYLNHGYSFFAPEPGPSFVLKYEVTPAEGEPIVGRLPDLDEHWPRLLYHRYFMIASQNADLVRQGQAQAAAQGSDSPPRGTDTFGHAVARHISRLHGDAPVALTLYVHRLLWPAEVRSGKRLEADDTYVFDDQVTYPVDADREPRSSPVEEVGP